MLITVIDVNLFADDCPFLEKHEMQMSSFSFPLLCRLLGNCFYFVRIRIHICTNKKIHKDKYIKNIVIVDLFQFDFVVNARNLAEFNMENL